MATYYPGPEKKTTVPLILVHDWKGSRTDLHSLAMFLQQSYGHTVIVPDLRGHGTSVRQRGSGRTDRPRQDEQVGLESMVLDVEAAKTYLLQRNNEEKLNIEQLGVLGVGFGATLALNWTVQDWQRPQPAVVQDGPGRQGADPHLPAADLQRRQREPGVEGPPILSQVVVVDGGRARRRRHATPTPRRFFKAFEGAHRR